MVKPADLPPPENLAELHERFGCVPLHRIRLVPLPGTATEQDVFNAPDGDLPKLIDGTLVSKVICAAESVLALEIARLLGNFVTAGNLGVVLGPDGGLRLLRGNIRFPDVTFISWDDLGADEPPSGPLWSVPPTLAVEVLSPSNTGQGIDRKLSEYFASGCKLAWVIDRDGHSARSYTAPDSVVRLGPGDTLEGGVALPGFKLPLSELLAPKRRTRKPE